MNNKDIEHDLTIHAVLMDDGTTNIHSHGLEKHGLDNLEIIIANQDRDWAEWAANLIYCIAAAEIEEGAYSLNTAHIMDNGDNYDEVYHVFMLTKIFDEFGDKVVYINYNFDYPINHPDTGKTFKFNQKKKKWVCVH